MLKEIVPTPSELSKFQRMTRLRGDFAVARIDLPPFTCVAVCPGRVFSIADHARLYSSRYGYDPYAQWTMYSARNSHSPRQGFVVTAGLPGNLMDAKYQSLEKYGYAPFFTQSLDEGDATCITVMRANRTEYWTGRLGVKAGDVLSVLLKFQLPNNMQEFWVMMPDSRLPVSIRWLTPHVLVRYGGYTAGDPGHEQQIMHHIRSRQKQLASAEGRRIRGPPQQLHLPPLAVIKSACMSVERPDQLWVMQVHAAAYGSRPLRYFSVVKPRLTKPTKLEMQMVDLCELLALLMALVLNTHMYAMDALRNVCLSPPADPVPEILTKFRFDNARHDIAELTPWAAEHVSREDLCYALLAVLSKSFCKAPLHTT